MGDLGPIVEAADAVLGPVARSLLRTTLGTVALTALVAALSVMVAANGSWLRGALGAVVAVLLGLTVGALLALKRAVFEALAAGVRPLGLGRRTLGRLVERMAGVREDETWKERGGSLVRMSERLPLAEAEGRLRAAALSVGAGAATGLRGRMLRRIERALVEQVEALTLARFRDASAREGGVDVLLVRDELSKEVDAVLVRTLDRLTFKITATLAGAAVTFALAVALAIRMSAL